MQITIHIEHATPEILKALASATNDKVVRSSTTKIVDVDKPRTFRWSKKAIKNLRTRTPEAPYGLKKDGTPRAKPGTRKKGTT